MSTDDDKSQATQVVEYVQGMAVLLLVFALVRAVLIANAVVDLVNHGTHTWLSTVILVLLAPGLVRRIWR
jgi:hypothetical protein